MSASAGNENGQAFIIFVRELAGEWYCPMCGNHFFPVIDQPRLPDKDSYIEIPPVPPHVECPQCGRIFKSRGKYSDIRTRKERRGSALSTASPLKGAIVVEDIDY
ncbi:MAG TPA: hypothetical protein VMS89_00670 [Methanoregulaceae archaeon]|nr:hypothetical protein [Methanoregulaceae archaeon]